MTHKVLVAFTTNAGSTTEVAQFIGDDLRKKGCEVDVFRLEEVENVSPYDLVVVGAPMILGWHRSAQQFVRHHQVALAQKQVAYFCTLMSLTDADLDLIGSAPVTVDPWLPKPPKNPLKLSYKERYATLANYLKPLVKAAPSVQPVSIGMFGGKMELFRLKWWQMLFVMLIIQAQPGDLRNWDFIQSWVDELHSGMKQVTGRS